MELNEAIKLLRELHRYIPEALAPAIDTVCAAAERSALEWRTVEKNGLPECDGVRVFVGMDCIGFLSCFTYVHTVLLDDGSSVIRCIKEGTVVISNLKRYALLERPE